jgi:hypothetical protein
VEGTEVDMVVSLFYMNQIFHKTQPLNISTDAKSRECCDLTVFLI